jgi:hypothetical protein
LRFEKKLLTDACFSTQNRSVFLGQWLKQPQYKWSVIGYEKPERFVLDGSNWPFDPRGRQCRGNRLRDRRLRNYHADRSRHDRKIISLVQSGKALEILEKGEEWSMVRTLNGKEGWVLNRYLTPSQPCAMVLDRVRQDYDVLAAKYEDLKEKIRRTQGAEKSDRCRSVPEPAGPRSTQRRL